MNEKKKTGGVEKEVKKEGEETIKISFWTGLLVYQPCWEVFSEKPFKVTCGKTLFSLTDYKAVECRYQLFGSISLFIAKKRKDTLKQ